MYLLDTNACIQLWQRKNPHIRQRLVQHGPTEIVLCSVVKAELLFGAMHSTRKEQNLLLLQKLFAPLASFEFDDNAAAHYADIRATLATSGKPIGANDLMIAAIARANHLTLITHNTREFARVPALMLEDWEVSPTA